MKDTLIDNQAVRLKEKISTFFTRVYAIRKDGPCLVKDVLAASLDKWSLFILFNLGYYEVMRFSALKLKIRGISSRMLSRTLKKLEKNGLVSREVHAEVPPRVEYRLTRFGQSFSSQLIDMSQWYVDHIDEEFIDGHTQQNS